MLLLCLSAGMLHAQDNAATTAPIRPAGWRGFRTSPAIWVFLPSGATDWSDANINRPLTTGDRLSTGHGLARRTGTGWSRLRIAGQTDSGVLALNDQAAQFELTAGTLNLTVRQLDQGQSYEIDTPTVALVIDGPGSFRVDINDDGGSSSTRA